MAFGFYVYKSKKTGQEWYLHVSTKKNRTLYYFSKESADALPALPTGMEVTENEKTGLPVLRKKKNPGLMDMLIGGIPPVTAKDEKEGQK